MREFILNLNFYSNTDSQQENIANLGKEESLSSTSFFQTLNWEENKESIIEENANNDFAVNELETNIEKKTSKTAMSDLLLNLSIDETNASQTQKTVLNCDISNDLFESSTAPQLDLFGEPNIKPNEEMASNVNLLNDLDFFSTNTVPPITTFESKPQNIMNENLSFIANEKLNFPTVPIVASNPSVTLQRNTSTPNLTKLDPLAELGSFLSSTSTTNKLNSPSIPRVSSYTTFPTANGSKPDYNRTNFADIPTVNSNTTGTSNARVVGNEFEDLLGSFKRAQSDCGTKSIGQLRKDEMVINFSPIN